MLAHAVDLRPRMSTPITDNTVGNLATLFTVEMDKDITGLRELTAKLRGERDEFLENFVKTKMVSETAVAALMRTFEEQGALVHNEEVELYRCSSWLRLNMYEADFGWGKPIWLSLVNMPYKNTMILINRRGSDGVEAWLTLQEDHMVALDQDEELLHFASLNSSVVW
ncbi:hypothetical protein MLD38_025478 [Melastoma candidum]|uniref:Uncharacterized protein n=1 Tax=Melastoma candidum TaxID=119954 RepID=A0ACB9NWX1_9MYRT|nr:hypothetical protein MLD38_025478 [Melastoma candidum]